MNYQSHARQQGEAWKNKIHFEIEKEGDKFYLCNQAVKTFEEKRTIEKDKVTCKNCLNKLNKEVQQ